MQNFKRSRASRLRAGTLASLLAMSLSAAPARAQTETDQDAAGRAALDEIVIDGVVGNARRGRRVFGRCRSCHDIGPNARHKTGPGLNDVIGHKIGEYEGYPSSLPMAYLGIRGEVWTPELLDRYLQSPAAFRIEELHMGRTSQSPFLGLAAARHRADVIAYLARNGNLSEN